MPSLLLVLLALLTSSLEGAHASVAEPTSTLVVAVQSSSLDPAPLEFADSWTADPAPLEAADSWTADSAHQPPRVFLDCQTPGCDYDLFRTELRWVDWVRDRQDADVHVMVTSQPTGGGGRQFDVSFEGRGELQGNRFTLLYSSGADDSTDDRRRGLLRTLSHGLAPFASGTDVGERLDLVLRDPAARPEVGPGAAPGVAPQDDPWDFWVFSTSANVFSQGESSQGSQNYSGSVSATRTTEMWKARVALSGSYRKTSFDLPDRSVVSIIRSYNGSGLLVRSLGDHWSAGVRASARSSTFANQDLALDLTPAIEYSLFPYGDHTRKALTFEYGIGPRYFNYSEETLFDQDEELRVEHSLSTSLNLRQPWGTVRTSISGAQYLHDLSKYEMTLGTNLNLRLFRGLSLNVGANYSRIHNQLHIPRRGASEEEVLLRRRQLATNYRYFTTIGVSYTFGSIFSNVVNPRMGGTAGGGGMVMMF
ncbi:MAG: DUF481 domain-containing protein [Gemmatimonadales bacterium]|nr:MAG: DUF481 domain-containing protein [Gemmatimonadales bacterium]